MSLILFTIFGASIVSLTIGIIVLLYSRRRNITHAFFTFSLGVAMWIGGFGLILATRDDGTLVFLNAGGLLLVIGLTRFAQVFPTTTPLLIRPIFFWSPLIIGGITMLISNTIVLNVDVLSNGEMEVTHGPLIGIWSSLLLTYIVISLFFFIRSYVHASSQDRERLWFVFVGISLFALSSILFDAILPAFFGFATLNQVGPLTSVLFLFTTAYAILKHGFLDIRIVIQRSLVYSTSFFVLAVSYVGLLLIAEHFTEDMIGITAPVSAGITVLIGMYTLPYMEAYFRKITDPFFFKDRYSYFDVLESLSEILNTNLNLRPLALQSLAVLEQTFKPQYGYFIRTETNTCYSHSDCTHAKFDEYLELHSIRIPVYSGVRMIGEYVLGPKRSGEKYSQTDRSLIKTFSGYATVAFEKAELFQKLREHTEQLEEKVDERTKHLRQLQERQREFFDDISHALQTPLTVLRSGTEILKKSLPLDHTRTHTNMEASIEDLSRLIRSILQLARVDTYSPDTDMQIIDFTEIVKRTTEYVHIIAETDGILVTTDFLCESTFIHGNEKQLEEVCINLLSNAIKYTATSKKKRIHISLTEDLDTAILRVKDTGIGMTPDQLAKVFERFYRAEQSDAKKEGYGLGLAITKRIVERHNGSIRFQSVPGVGTTVSITLPSVPQEVFQP